MVENQILEDVIDNDINQSVISFTQTINDKLAVLANK